MLIIVYQLDSKQIDTHITKPTTDRASDGQSSWIRTLLKLMLKQHKDSNQNNDCLSEDYVI